MKAIITQSQGPTDFVVIVFDDSRKVLRRKLRQTHGKSVKFQSS